MAGKVLVSGKVQTKAGTPCSEDVEINLKEEDHPFVSRGALKLKAALDSFDVAVEGVHALDIGASTGGFTDLLLQRGASRVYAVDVGLSLIHI